MARGRGGRLVSKRPHSRSPGHDPPNPASPSTTGPSAERAREQQQGAYAVGFSLGGGLALCQHADRTIIYLYGRRRSVTSMQARTTPVARGVPARARIRHVWAGTSFPRVRACARYGGMGRSPENAYSFLSHPRPSDENFRYSGDRAGFMAGSHAGSFGDRARLPMEAAWTPAGPPPR